MSAHDTTMGGSIEFRCMCGARYHVAARLAGRKARCATCGTSLLIPGDSPAPPPPDEPTAPCRVSEEEPSREEAEAVAVSPICGVCQCSIDDGDAVTSCPECHLPFHAGCWEENLGCSTYGCQQVNALKKGPDIRVGGLPQAGAPGGTFGLDQRMWHCAIDARIYGPASALELTGWFRDGRITVQTTVWRAGMQSWQPLSAVPDLLRAVSPTHAVQAAQAAVPGFPWEMALLPASAVGFLAGLVTYGVTSAIAAVAILVFACVKAVRAGAFMPPRSTAYHVTRPWEGKYIALTVLAFLIALVGFIIGVGSNSN